MKVIIKQHPGTGLWVTSDGRVILPPSPRYPKFRFTYGSKNDRGYLRVKFRYKAYKVHRLIAETFLDNPDNKPTIDHKDRNPQNNAVSNLRWCDMKTQLENRQIVYDSLARYGVRSCDNATAYQRARRAEDPEKYRAYMREWQDRQRALGRRPRKCPDGKQHWLTDEEFDARYGINRQLTLF